MQLSWHCLMLDLMCLPVTENSCYNTVAICRQDQPISTSQQVLSCHALQLQWLKFLTSKITVLS